MTTILITGGGRGLGRATMEKLAAAGHRGIAATEIRQRHPGALVEARAVDLASLSAVRTFANAVAPC